MHGLGALDPAEREAFEERAAIAEFDGGMSRPVAECEATRMIGEMRWWLHHGLRSSGARGDGSGSQVHSFTDRQDHSTVLPASKDRD